MQTCLSSWKFAAPQASVLRHSKQTAETKRKHHFRTAVLVARTVLPHLWSANQQVAQHERSRLEVLEEGAGGVRLPFLTETKCLPTVARELCLTSCLDPSPTPATSAKVV